MTMADSTIKILVAEDSPTQALQLRHLLEQQGYGVEIAGNGRLALESARRQRPTMILSDVVMPEMDGYELCRGIKTDSELAMVPVILVTTLSDPYDVIRGLECHADNFIVKPYEARYLLDRVAHVLANRALSRAPVSAPEVEIYFSGKRHAIAADRRQILELLLSTYDAAVERNKALDRSHEELRLVNARLAAVNKELESFSYSVSHDLRAPLRHIDGYVQIMREDSASVYSTEAERCMKIITEASRRMASLIDDLLRFSRMGQAPLHEANVALDDLLAASLRDLELATRGRQIVWRVPALPRVMGDPSLLQQVFSNLLANAVKYTRPRATAIVEVGWYVDDGGRAVVFVRDNGVGFDSRYADRLFGVFQRLHRADEFEGTGIGLAIVQRIVARHGGRVWAEAAPDAGATFYFSLRRAVEESP